MLPSVEVKVCHQPNCVVPLKFWSLVEVTLPLLRIKLPLKVTVFPFTAEVIVVSPLKTRALIAVTAEFTFAVPLKVISLEALTSAPTVASPVKAISFTAVTVPFTVAVPLKAISVLALTLPLEFTVAASSKLTPAPPDVTAALKSAVPAKLTAPPTVTVAPELIAAFPLK